jgi:hypothetical protein
MLEMCRTPGTDVICADDAAAGPPAMLRAVYKAGQRVHTAAKHQKWTTIAPSHV